MKYPRFAYRDPAITTETVSLALSGLEFEIPHFEMPITARENFVRAAKRSNPLWVPTAISDFQTIMAQDTVDKDDRNIVIHTDFKDPRNRTQDYTFTDWFNTNWTWVASAGGAMLTPGTKLVDDITDWEKVVVWPKLSEWDFKSKAERYMKTQYNPEKVMHVDIGRGLTERFISVVGGYTEGMLALAAEPEAVSAFFDRLADFIIDWFDVISELYPFDMLTYHDDWGTERDTFFSEKMMEELVYNPTKKIINHVRAKGVMFELHSCGNITRFMPYICELGPDFLQIQRRAVDIPALKVKFGDKVGFNTGIEGYIPEVTDEELVSCVRKTVDLYGRGGGFYASVYGNDPKRIWNILSELFAYSREYYEAVC